MTIEPIVRVKMDKFRSDYQLDSIQDDILFEKYVNYNILMSHQPYDLTTDNELLDATCLGGGNDMGIDGIAIVLNGRFVKALEDIDDILSGNKRAKFEFIFVQSKNKSKFDLGEFGKFVSGVEDFLQETIVQPHNNEIKVWHQIKEYIFSDKILLKWECNPCVRLYYVALGTWENNEHILAYSKSVHDRLIARKCFDQVNFHYIDSKALNDIINNNSNSYSTVLNFIDSMSLTEVVEVDNSYVIMCYASELINLLSTNENLIRRNLFEDNVRDFQGETTINSEIRDTLINQPESFMLLNNGITIVCDEAQLGNRKIIIRNPQIVNGCQTCNVLFQSHNENINLNKTSVVIKIIATKNPEISNKVVKGANRQNIVFDEAFEITREFHKLLEEFFTSMKTHPNEKLYYERRSKQYYDNPLVKPYQRVSFKVLIQSTVSLFLFKVHEGHRHESKLLLNYRNKMFVDNQSFYPYYVSAALYMELENLFRKNQLDKRKYTYKMHIMLIIKELACGCSPDINQKALIEKYCKNLLQIISEPKEFLMLAKKAIKTFDLLLSKWTRIKGESHIYGVKDSAVFSIWMLEELRNESIDEELEEKSYLFVLPDEPLLLSNETLLRGRVLDVKKDKHAKLFGFISREPDNIFFHQEDNGHLDEWNIKGKDVTYVIAEATRGERAIEIRIVE